jgi:hypothetical protein
MKDRINAVDALLQEAAAKVKAETSEVDALLELYEKSVK